MKDPDVHWEAKNYAAMCTMVDNNLGSIQALLRELGIEEDTIVFFTGDNGGQPRFKSEEHPHGFFWSQCKPSDQSRFSGR